MKELIKENENLLYSIINFIIGIICLLYMKISTKGEDPKDVGSFDQSVRFGVYLAGCIGIIGGFYILLKGVLHLI